VQDWQQHWPSVLPLPHPSLRNNIWLKKNPWFAAEIVPMPRGRIAARLKG
jgi:uracil-DNA glycosylase